MGWVWVVSAFYNCCRVLHYPFFEAQFSNISTALNGTSWSLAKLQLFFEYRSSTVMSAAGDLKPKTMLAVGLVLGMGVSFLLCRLQSKRRESSEVAAVEVVRETCVCILCGQKHLLCVQQSAGRTGGNSQNSNAPRPSKASNNTSLPSHLRVAILGGSFDPITGIFADVERGRHIQSKNNLSLLFFLLCRCTLEGCS